MNGAALATAQIPSALWSRPDARVHAVIDGSVLAGLPTRLQAAQTMGWDCLQRGALTADAAARAAYIVELQPESEFTAAAVQAPTTDTKEMRILIAMMVPLKR